MQSAVSGHPNSLTLTGDVDKVKRRLAQNREAARKSRQRRKAYVQNLEDEVCCTPPFDHPT